MTSRATSGTGIVLLDSRGAVPDYVAELAAALADGDGRPAVTAIGSSRMARACADRGRALAYFELAFQGGLANLGSFARGWLKTLALIRRDRPRVVHVQWLTRPVPEAMLLRALRRPLGFRFVYTAHNVLPHEARPADRRIYARVYRSADAVIVHTESAKAELTGLFPSVDAARVHVVPHGVPAAGSASDREQARRSFGVGEGATLIAAIGKIRPYKGIDVLLEAFALAREEANVELLIAGHPDDPAYTSALERQLATMGDAGVHRRLAYLSNDELGDAFAATDVVALPYRQIDQSGIFARALGYGRPLVVSDLPGFREFVASEPGAAAFHAPADARELADLLVALARDPERRAEMSRSARALASRFSWANVATTTLTRVYAS